MRLKRIGLQFFAEPNPDPNPAPGAGGDPNPGAGGDPAPAPQGKTFTQEEVNRMLANEKRQGRTSVLKELGIDPEDKDGVKNAKDVLDSQKTQAQRDSEALATEKTARSEAEARATAAERKMAVLMSGCKKEFVDEVTALAAVKVNDSTDFEAALKAVKEKCPAFFGEDEGGSPSAGGTGKGQGHRRQGGSKPGEFGSRLAQGAVSNTPKENPYFKF